MNVHVAMHCKSGNFKVIKLPRQTFVFINSHMNEPLMRVLLAIQYLMQVIFVTFVGTKTFQQQKLPDLHFVHMHAFIHV